MYSKIGLGEGLQHPLKTPSYKVRITNRQVILEPTPTANSCIISLRCLLEQFDTQWSHVFLTVLRWFIFKDGSPTTINRLKFRQHSVPWMMFPQRMNISSNGHFSESHFFIYLYLHLLLYIKVARANEFQQKIYRIILTIN